MAGKRDEVLDKFDELIYGKKLTDIVPIEPGTSARRRRKAEPEPTPYPFVVEQGTDYAAKSQLQDREKLFANAEMHESFQKNRIKGPGMSMLEEDSTICGDLRGALDEDILAQKVACFDEFDFSKSDRPQLAIDAKRDEIINQIRKRNVVMITGFTGCGKTTQVPQFILDECYKTKTPCNILVTQPRRIAAISIAARVCHERNWSLGSVCGYAVGMDRQTTPFTCLTYMTTGCLLERLVSTKSLDGITHIIIDEVHERDEDTDLLLMIVKKLLFFTPNCTKVILMSATAEPHQFCQYFASPVEGVLVNAPEVHVPPLEPHPVRVYHLDDLQHLNFLQFFTPRQDLSMLPGIEETTFEMASRLIAALDEKREIMRFGRHSQYANISSTRGAVLVFLPGLGEIEAMHKALVQFDQVCDNDKKNHWYILPLHSRITSEEQRRVFQKPPKEIVHSRKIILSTNIAESSLTVPDIVYVIDFCLVKQLVTDPDTNFCSLKLDWASKSSCVQRKGRVGRVGEGVVYRMVYKDFYERVLPNDIPPEIERCPLEHTVLRLKMLDIGSPKELMGLLISPPECQNIVRTIFTLKEVGALFLTANGKVSIEDGDLSYLGHVVAKLPIEIHLGKLIMLGYIFNVFEECVIMAAGLASKNIFISPFQKKLFAYRVKMGWDDRKFSDPMCILKAYQTWQQMHLNEQFKRPGEPAHIREKKWAEANFIELKALKDMDVLVRELYHRLEQLGIKSISGPNVRRLKDSERSLLLYVVIHGAFYPQYFSRDSQASRVDEREAVRSLGGLDPYTSVRLQGFPTDQPAKAYLQQIKEHLLEIKSLTDETWSPKIKLDAARVLIQFQQEGNPYKGSKMGRICLPVYLALKQRLIDGGKYTLSLMDRREAEEFSRKVEEDGKRLLGLSDTASVASSNYSCRSECPRIIHVPDPRTPKFNEYQLDLTICHIETPDRFWCQRLGAESRMDYKQINRIIGKGGAKLKPFKADHEVRKGYMVVGPFQTEQNGPFEYFRAKVLSVLPKVQNHDRRVRLFFIDFGNTTEVYFHELRAMPDELVDFPPLAFECRLVGIGPNLILDPQGKWSPLAIDLLESQGLHYELKGKIYSVVDGLTTLDLVKEENQNWEESFAEQLVARNLAVRVEEPYMSKMDHEERQNCMESKSTKIEDYKMKERELERTSIAELIAVDEEKDNVLDVSRNMRNFRGGRKHRMQGPYNPLEMRMYSKLQSLQGYTLSVENDSVNSVLLDEFPSDSHERLLIAAQVGAPNSHNKITARSTTLLPSIPGLPSILTLIFAPRVELRADKKRERLIGAICGLGFDRATSHALYQAHDMEISFDTEIGLKDVLDISRIRYWINSVLGIKSYTTHYAGPTPERLREVNSKVLKLLFEVIEKRRKDVEPVATFSFKWNCIPEQHILRGDVQENQYDTLIPMLDGIKLVLPERN